MKGGGRELAPANPAQHRKRALGQRAGQARPAGASFGEARQRAAEPGPGGRRLGPPAPGSPQRPPAAALRPRPPSFLPPALPGPRPRTHNSFLPAFSQFFIHSAGSAAAIFPVCRREPGWGSSARGSEGTRRAAGHDGSRSSCALGDGAFAAMTHARLRGRALNGRPRPLAGVAPSPSAPPAGCRASQAAACSPRLLALLSDARP